MKGTWVGAWFAASKKSIAEAGPFGMVACVLVIPLLLIAWLADRRGGSR